MPAKPGGKTIAGNVARPQQPPSSPTPSSPSPERITVALIPKAAADLQQLQERSGLSKTDLTNRAISLYEFIDAQIREGRDVIFREPAKKETQIDHVFG